jgi:hypothetical protein
MKLRTQKDGACRLPTIIARESQPDRAVVSPHHHWLSIKAWVDIFWEDVSLLKRFTHDAVGLLKNMHNGEKVSVS